jgi:hypothetical protein
MIIQVLDAGQYDCTDRSTGAPCNGSRCMAWRWADLRRVYGYCGLAGVPLNTQPEVSGEFSTGGKPLC